MMLHSFKTCVVGLTLVVGATMPALAAPNLVTNGSFETYNTTTSTFTGWTNSGTTGTTPSQYAVQQPTDNSTPGTYGDVVRPDPFTASPDAAATHAAYFVADEANQSLSQTVALTIGQTYEVGFDLFKNPSGAGNSGGFTMTGAIGNTVITSASSATLQTGTWTHFASRFVAATSSATFSFNYNSGTAPAADVLADLVYVTSVPAPEPASIALLGAGVAGLVAFSRRRRRTYA